MHTRQPLANAHGWYLRNFRLPMLRNGEVPRPFQFSTTADGLYTFSIGLAATISPQFQLSIELLDTFKNRPPGPDIEKNDVALVTAITAKF